MPIFAYQCGACGHRFDELQKLADAPLTICPECGDASLKKLLSAPSFHLKGGGWRKSDDGAKPKKRPKYVHAFDSPVPHADHHSDGAHSHDHSHGHSHDHGTGHDHGHTHDHKKDSD